MRFWIVFRLDRCVIETVYCHNATLQHYYFRKQNTHISLETIIAKLESHTHIHTDKMVHIAHPPVSLSLSISDSHIVLCAKFYLVWVRLNSISQNNFVVIITNENFS